MPNPNPNPKPKPNPNQAGLSAAGPSEAGPSGAGLARSPPLWRPPPPLSEQQKADDDEAGPSEAELNRSPSMRHRQLLLAQAPMPAQKQYLTPLAAADLPTLTTARQPPALPPIGQFHAFVTDAEPAVHLSEDTTPVPNSAWKAAKAAARERRRERRALATPRGTVTAPTWRAPPPLPPDTPR